MENNKNTVNVKVDDYWVTDTRTGLRMLHFEWLAMREAERD